MIGPSVAATGAPSDGASGKVLLKIMANRLDDFCKEAGILPEEQVRLRASTFDNRYDVRNLKAAGTGTEQQHFTRNLFINLVKVYDSVDRWLLWEVLARFGVSSRMAKIIRMFHDGMLARVQLDDGDFSAWFNIYQGLCQECVLSPLLFNIFFAAVIIVVLQRFAADLVIASDLVYLDNAPKGEAGPGRRGRYKWFGEQCGGDCMQTMRG